MPTKTEKVSGIKFRQHQQLRKARTNLWRTAMSSRVQWRRNWERCTSESFGMIMEPFLQEIFLPVVRMDPNGNTGKRRLLSVTTFLMYSHFDLFAASICDNSARSLSCTSVCFARSIKVFASVCADVSWPAIMIGVNL